MSKTVVATAVVQVTSQVGPTDYECRPVVLLCTADTTIADVMRWYAGIGGMDRGEIALVSPLTVPPEAPIHETTPVCPECVAREPGTPSHAGSRHLKGKGRGDGG